ncbi:hypothetical protein EV121DRAFT_174054, partial [Schizophyllum commune]
RIPITTSAVVRDWELSRQRPAVIAVQSCVHCGAVPLLSWPRPAAIAVLSRGRSRLFARCAFIGRAP